MVRRGQSDRSLEEFSKAHEIAPDQPGYGYAFALALNGSGQTRQALDLLETSRARWPQNNDILFALATMSRDLALFGEAREYVRQLLLINPGNPSYRAFADELEKGSLDRH